MHAKYRCITVQGELGSKDDAVKELRRWLDQAQGQLQNTQTALHEREAECKTLSADLKAVLADLKALKVGLACPSLQKCQTHTPHLPCLVCCSCRLLCWTMSAGGDNVHSGFDPWSFRCVRIPVS